MKKALLLLVILVMLGMGGIYYATHRVGAGGVAKTPPPFSSNVALNKAKQQYADSLARAHDWQSNATLERIYRIYDGTLRPDPGPPLIYAYSSLADTSRSFEVVYNGNDLQTKKTVKVPTELQLNPIDTSQWQIDPDHALQIAEDNGGKAFREAHLPGFKLTEQLQLYGKFPLMWYFRYDTGDGTKLRHEIYVNAQSGNIELQREIPQT